MEISLLEPAALYGLLLLPVLALLQLLLPRAREITVGSLIFWQTAVADASVSTARWFRRLDLASWLLLLTLGAIILALSGPGIVGSPEQGVVAVMAIDTSPSLLMTDGGSQSRLKALRTNVETFLSELPPGMQIAVVTIPGSTGDDAIEGAAGDIRDRVMSRLRASQRPLEARILRNRLLLLHNMTAAPVVLFTDLSPYDDGAAPPPFVHLLATGGRATNLALTRANVSFRPEGPFAMVSYRASAGLEARATMTFSGPGLAPLRLEMAFAPGEGTWTFPVPRALPDQVAIEVELTDDFAADNRLRLVRTEARRWRIGYVGRADPSLLALMRAADAEVYEIDAAAGLWPEELDLTVFVDRLPPEGFDGPAVLVNPPSSTGPLERTGRKGGHVENWAIADPGHPLASNLPTRGPKIIDRPSFKLAAGTTVIITADQGDPLVVAYRDAASRRVAVLFDIAAANTNWADQVSFVLFWSNCFRFLSAGAPAAVRYEPATVAEATLGDLEGRQTAGPAIDQSQQAIAALASHRRQRRPSAFPLWPVFAILALLLLVVRTRMMR